MMRATVEEGKAVGRSSVGEIPWDFRYEQGL